MHPCGVWCARWKICSTASLVVRCEGQRLVATYSDDAAMNDALAQAPWETLEFELAPA